MKDAIRIDEIDDYLRDGGSLEELMIQTEPSRYRRIWSKAGMEIDRDKDNAHNWVYNPYTGRWDI